MLDAEDFGDGRHPTIDQVDRYARQLHAEIGRWPIAYVPGWWLDKHRYTVAGRALVNCPWAPSRFIPGPWTEARLRAARPAGLRGFRSLAWLRYTGSATVAGISGTVDANVHYGTLNQLRAALLGAPAEEADLTPVEHSILIDIQRRVSITDEIQSAIGTLTADVADVQRRVSVTDETVAGVAALVRLTIIDLRSRGIQIPPEALARVAPQWIPAS